MFMAYENCPVVPSWPPDPTRLDGGYGGYRTGCIVRHVVEEAPTPGPGDYLFARFQTCWKAEELMALTISSNSRYRDSTTVNQWLENQDSWLEGLLKGGRKRDVGKKRKPFFF